MDQIGSKRIKLDQTGIDKRGLNKRDLEKHGLGIVLIICCDNLRLTHNLVRTKSAFYLHLSLVHIQEEVEKIEEGDVTNIKLEEYNI